MSENKHGFGTRTIHAGQDPDPTTGAVNIPVYFTSTYQQASPGQHKGFAYARTDNPTRSALQACLASLEGGKHALTFASGLAATDTLFHTLKPGDHVLCCDDAYGGTFRILDKVWKNHGIEMTFADLGDVKKAEAAFKPNTKIMWMETPTNPMMKVLDIAGLTALARKKGVLSVVDNTFMSPYFQKPLSLGADVVVHSTTKYINGHSDVIGGAIMLNDSELYKQLKFLQSACGGTPGPMDAFLILRGLKTLHVRMERHASNAMEIARWLKKHPKVDQVFYPGLEEHPGHALAKKQASGFGGMISFYVKGGLPETRAVLERFKVFALAESLGGVESLVNHPAIMTHASVPAERRKELGIHDNLVRLSVGIEDLADLQEDLRQALG